jgi:acyl-CoA thioesterase-1
MRNINTYVIVSIFFICGCSNSNKPLPKILIIGDSISGGYFPYVKENLAGKAELFQPIIYDDKGHIKSCCGGTTQGVNEIDIYLSEKKWDIIHFNFGLHDIKHIDPITGKNSKNLSHPHQASPEQYEKNLIEIVEKLKLTGAKLIFATTTPYPDKLGKQMRSPGMPKVYNEVALKVMGNNGIEINDLYGLVLPRMEELQRPNNVHFLEKGSEVLAEHITKILIQKF